MAWIGVMSLAELKAKGKAVVRHDRSQILLVPKSRNSSSRHCATKRPQMCHRKRKNMWKHRAPRGLSISVFNECALKLISQ
jgi:hypothetical protein